MQETLQKQGLIEQGDVLPSTEVTPETSFNECLHCEFCQNGCSGPNFLVTDIDRICDMMQAQRIKLRWSYQKLADVAGMTVLTVKRILNKQVKDPSFQSMQKLVIALFADPNGKFPCAKRLIISESDKHLVDALASEQRKVAYLQEQIRFKEEQMRQKDKQIEERGQLLAERRDFLYRKDRTITVLGVLLGISVISIIAALVIDLTNPNMGFFWLEQATALLSSI